MPEITRETYRTATGSDPINDDLERANCDKAGTGGHMHCGWSEAANLPYTMTSRTVETAAGVAS
jgi:hypothetical protein